MCDYNRMLKAYLKRSPLEWKERQVEGVLDFLEQCYLEENPVECERTKALEKEMSPIYEALPFDMSEKLFCFVYKLCGEYEKAAFREGIRVGLHLRHELEGL